jgi:hypothetical protein
MFLVFKKTFLFKQPLVAPPVAPVLHISHSGSLPRRPPRPIRPESGEGTFKAPGQNLISPACPSVVPSPPVLAHLHLEFAATVLPTALSSRKHKTPFPSPVID